MHMLALSVSADFGWILLDMPRVLISHKVRTGALRTYVRDKRYRSTGIPKAAWIKTTRRELYCLWFGMKCLGVAASSWMIITRSWIPKTSRWIEKIPKAKLIETHSGIVFLCHSRKHSARIILGVSAIAVSRIFRCQFRRSLRACSCMFFGNGATTIRPCGGVCRSLFFSVRLWRVPGRQT